MSIFSIASSKDTSSLDMVFKWIQVNHYHIYWKYFFVPLIVFDDLNCQGASIPPKTNGCNVLTLPSKISGKSVTSEIKITSTPASCKTLALPPVEIIW